MARYGLFLNDEEDIEIIKYLEGKNVSAHLRNLLKQNMDKQEKIKIIEEINKSKQEVIDTINKNFTNLERLIENQFYKLNSQVTSTATADKNNKAIKKTEKNLFNDNQISADAVSNIKI